MSSDVFLYHAEAAYVDSSTGASVTLPCAVLYNANIQPTAALSVSCELTLATTYMVSIFHSRTNPQHLGGSPHILTIPPAATDPDSCAVEFPSGKSIVAGSSFDAVVIPFDNFDNPTAHAEDAFESRVELGSSRENINNCFELPPDHTFSELQTIAGSYKLYLYHVGTQEQVAGTPISFDVLPAAPSAASSTASAGNATSIVSAVDTALPLQALLHDEFGNEVLDAPGVVVNIRGLDPLDPAAVVEHVLEGPRYSHTVTVLQDLEATLTVSFSLDGAQIGEPLEIFVSSPPPPEDPFSANNVFFLAGVFFFGGLLIYYGYAHLTKTANDTSLKTKAKEVRANLLMIALNVTDVLTDFLNWNITIARACAGMVNHL
ncbi:hypothetical protein TeGR_g11388 [Tetraparma gracilis]|uniref:Uncharacterized protein n=1 Tax=Tetraparma gracilis TaxID=2962635 RepID=A0ABQ6NC79_9STRA|nr:hypothetical protein TeGR_g11388 [Tetraparma gracilis]